MSGAPEESPESPIDEVASERRRAVDLADAPLDCTVVVEGARTKGRDNPVGVATLVRSGVCGFVSHAMSSLAAKRPRVIG